MKFFKLLAEQFKKIRCFVTNRQDLTGGSICDVSGCYDVGYDTRMIKTRKTMVTVRLLAAIKEKKPLQDIDRPKNIKISKHTAIF